MKLTPLGTEKEGFSAVYRVYLSEPQKLSISCLKRGPPYNSDSDSDNGIYMIEYVMDCIGETEGVLMMNYSTNQEDLLDSEKYKIINTTTTTTSTNSIGKPLDVMFMQQQEEEKSNQNLYYRLTVDKSTGVLLAIRLKSMQAEAAGREVEKSYYYTHETLQMLSSHSLVTTTT
jgi:hypothetical protein